MRMPIKDCQCEDFPCCEHADNSPSEPDYCEDCGIMHMGICPQEIYEDDEDYCEEHCQVNCGEDHELEDDELEEKKFQAKVDWFLEDQHLDSTYEQE